MISPSVSDEVIQARDSGAPIVALESTIVTHGLPFPLNIETARRAEGEIRDAGAVPATIAVIHGQIHIGMSDNDLRNLARNPKVAKLSRADLPMAVVQGKTGSTTVAATMICAYQAGIEVFATGGIGGVHRGAETSFDISADLRELALTPVTVVSAGAKAVLDIAKTLEVLETLGIPVIAMGQDYFPAFWSRDSGLKAPLRSDSARDIARAHRVRRDLGLTGGQLVANPVPAEAEIPYPEIRSAVDAALNHTVAEGVTGKDVTPFLLSRVLELTERRSLSANVALLLNNARLAAEIARELQWIR